MNHQPADELIHFSLNPHQSDDSYHNHHQHHSYTNWSSGSHLCHRLNKQITTLQQTGASECLQTLKKNWLGWGICCEVWRSWIRGLTETGVRPSWGGCLGGLCSADTVWTSVLTAASWNGSPALPLHSQFPGRQKHRGTPSIPAKGCEARGQAVCKQSIHTDLKSINIYVQWK